MRIFPLALLAGGAALVIWNLVGPIEHSVPARLGKLAGEFEAQWTEARKEAVAAQAEEIAEANARVQRRTLAAQTAIQAEAQTVKGQIDRTRQSSWVAMIMANLADGACALGMLAEAQGNPDAHQSAKYCEAGDRIRRDVAESFGDALDGTRTTVMQDMTRAFDAAQDGAE